MRLLLVEGGMGSEGRGSGAAIEAREPWISDERHWREDE